MNFLIKTYFCKLRTACLYNCLHLQTITSQEKFGYVRIISDASWEEESSAYAHVVTNVTDLIHYQ